MNSKSYKKCKEKAKKDKEQINLFRKMWARCHSETCEVRHSEIHGRGVYASCDITKEQKIVEYVGELVDKAESLKRANRQLKQAAQTGDAAVYIFTLDDDWDLDGNLPWNIARLINHSCEPNCEAWMRGHKIFIHALRDIRKGEELTFDYGFDIDTWKEHPCLCGSKNCVGYIVSRNLWHELEKRKAEELAIEKKPLTAKKIPRSRNRDSL